MKLLFKQRFFSWFDSYDIYDESGETMFTVEGQLSWGHELHVLDKNGSHIATLKERIFTFLPKFEIYIGEEYVGEIVKEFTFFKPSFSVDFMGWSVDGDFFEWDYEINDGTKTVATVSKELFNWTDTYTIDVNDPADALPALLAVLAIDAVKCSQK
ncbi:MAG: LURP-one-related family protein [Clostridia bacterium]|nr:LURP-one-related family protein [Clostridia bacterium]